jgi:hypothetical protein
MTSRILRVSVAPDPLITRIEAPNQVGDFVEEPIALIEFRRIAALAAR